MLTPAQPLFLFLLFWKDVRKREVEMAQGGDFP